MSMYLILWSVCYELPCLLKLCRLSLCSKKRISVSSACSHCCVDKEKQGVKGYRLGYFEVFFSIDRRRPFHHVLLGTIDRVDFFLSGDSDAVGHCGDPPQGRKNPRHPSWWMLRYKTMDFIHRSKQDASGHWTHVIDPVNEVEPVPKHSPYNYVVQLLLSTNCI